MGRKILYVFRGNYQRRILEKKPISGIKGFKDEVSPFKPLL